jgi:Fe-S-cluster containining protein
MTDDELVPMPFTVTWHGRKIEANAGIPVKPIRPRHLLPLVQGFANAVTKLAEAANDSVTCREGCAACCRRLVPVTRSEAHHYLEDVNVLPQPLQSEIRERFEAGKRKLAETGLLEKLQGNNAAELDREYFALGIPCPFLDDESCAIHPDRPLACREHLVTSPAELCATNDDVRTVTLPALSRTSFAALDDGDCIPLILALDWAEANPEPPASVPGIELFDRFVQGLRPGVPS